MIYPLEWQYIFIPILPDKLIDFLCSPTPFLIGLLTSTKNRIFSFDNYPMEDIIMFDLDRGEILKYDTESQDACLSNFLKSRLKFLIEEAFRIENACNLNTSDSLVSLLNERLSGALLNFFLTILGCYREFMQINLREKRAHVTFGFNNFIENHPLISTNSGLNSHYYYTNIVKCVDNQKNIEGVLLNTKFLDNLSASQSFHRFIQQREEAFQYHYNLHIQGLNHYDVISNLKSLSSFSSCQLTYYTLTESRFEERINEIERV